MLRRLNEIDDFGNATCNLKEFNQYRGYLQRLNIECMNKRFREHINRIRYVNLVAKREWKVQCQVQRDSEAVHRQIRKRRQEMAIQHQKDRMRSMIAQNDVAMRAAYKEKLEVIRAPMYARQKRRRLYKRRQEIQKDAVDKYMTDVRQEYVDIKEEKILVKNLQKAQARYNWYQRRNDERAEFFEQKQRFHEAKMNQLIYETEENAMKKICRVEWWNTYYDKNHRAEQEHTQQVLADNRLQHKDEKQRITESLMMRGISDKYCWYPREDKQLIERIQAEIADNEDKFSRMPRSKMANEIYCTIREEGEIELKDRVQARNFQSQAVDITCHTIMMARLVLVKEGYDKYSLVITSHMPAICQQVIKEIVRLKKPPKLPADADGGKASKRIRMENELHNQYEMEVLSVKETVEEVLRAMFGRVLIQITAVADQIDYEDENYMYTLTDLTSFDPNEGITGLNGEASKDIKHRVSKVMETILKPILSGAWTMAHEAKIERARDLFSPAVSLLAAKITDDVVDKIEEENKPPEPEPVTFGKGKAKKKEEPAKPKKKKKKKVEEEPAPAMSIADVRNDFEDVRSAASTVIFHLAEDMIAKNPNRQPATRLSSVDEESSEEDSEEAGPSTPRFEPPDLSQSKLHGFAVDAISGRLAQRAMKKMDGFLEADEENTPINRGEEMNFSVEALADELSLKLLVATSPQPGDIEPISLASGEEGDAHEEELRQRNNAKISKLVYNLVYELLEKTIDIVIQQKLPEIEAETEGITSEAIQILAEELTHRYDEKIDHSKVEDKIGIQRIAIGYAMTLLADVIMDIALIMSKNREEDKQDRKAAEEETEDLVELKTADAAQSVTSVLTVAISIISAVHLHRKDLPAIVDVEEDPSNLHINMELKGALSILADEVMFEAHEKVEGKMTELAEEEFKPRSKKANKDDDEEEFQEIMDVCCEWTHLADLNFKEGSVQGRIHLGIVLAMEHLATLLHPEQEIMKEIEDKEEYRDLCVKFLNDPIEAVKEIRKLRSSGNNKSPRLGRTHFPKRLQHHINKSLYLTAHEIVDKFKAANVVPTATELEGLMQYVVSHAVLDILSCQINELIHRSMGTSRLKKDRLSRHTYALVGSIVNLKCSTIGWPKMKPCQMRPLEKEDFLELRRYKKLDSMEGSHKLNAKEREIKAAGIKTKIICGFEAGSVKCFMDKKPNYDNYGGSNFCWKKNVHANVNSSKDYRKSYMYHSDDDEDYEDVCTTALGVYAVPGGDDDEYEEWAADADQKCDELSQFFVDNIVDMMEERGDFDPPPAPEVPKSNEPFDPIFNRTMRDMKSMLKFVAEKKREEELEKKRLEAEARAAEEERLRLEELALMEDDEPVTTDAEDGESVAPPPPQPLQDGEEKPEGEEGAENGEGEEGAENGEGKEGAENGEGAEAPAEGEGAAEEEAAPAVDEAPAEGDPPEPSTGAGLLYSAIDAQLCDDVGTEDGDSVYSQAVAKAVSSVVDDSDEATSESDHSGIIPEASQRSVHPDAKKIEETSLIFVKDGHVTDRSTKEGSSKVTTSIEEKSSLQDSKITEEIHTDVDVVFESRSTDRSPREDSNLSKGTETVSSAVATALDSSQPVGSESRATEDITSTDSRTSIPESEFVTKSLESDSGTLNSESVTKTSKSDSVTISVELNTKTKPLKSDSKTKSLDSDSGSISSSSEARVPAPPKSFRSTLATVRSRKYQKGSDKSATSCSSATSSRASIKESVSRPTSRKSVSKSKKTPKQSSKDSLSRPASKASSKQESTSRPLSRGSVKASSLSKTGSTDSESRRAERAARAYQNSIKRNAKRDFTDSASRPSSGSSSSSASERVTKASRAIVSRSSNRSSKDGVSRPLSVVSHVSKHSDGATKNPTNVSTKERISRRAQKAFEASVSRASSKTSRASSKTSRASSKSSIDSRQNSISRPASRDSSNDSRTSYLSSGSSKDSLSKKAVLGAYKEKVAKLDSKKSLNGKMPVKGSKHSSSSSSDDDKSGRGSKISARLSVERSKSSKDSVHSASFKPHPPKNSRPASRSSDSSVSARAKKAFEKSISRNSSGPSYKNGVSLSSSKHSSKSAISRNTSQQSPRDRDASPFTKPTSSKGSVSLNINKSISRPASKASTVESVTRRTSKAYRDSISPRSSKTTSRASVTSPLSTTSSNTNSRKKVPKVSSKATASSPAASRRSPTSQPGSNVESDKNSKSPSPAVSRKHSSIVDSDEEFNMKIAQVSLSGLSNAVSSEVLASHSASVKHRISMSDSNEASASDRAQIESMVEERINRVLSGTRYSTSDVSLGSAKEYPPARSAVSSGVISTEMSTNNAHQSFLSSSGSSVQE